MLTIALSSFNNAFNSDDFPIKIIDTAGIREASDEVEKIGIERAKEIADNADLLIAIFLFKLLILLSTFILSWIKSILFNTIIAFLI